MEVGAEQGSSTACFFVYSWSLCLHHGLAEAQGCQMSTRESHHDSSITFLSLWSDLQEAFRRGSFHLL